MLLVTLNNIRTRLVTTTQKEGRKEKKKKRKKERKERIATHLIVFLNLQYKMHTIAFKKLKKGTIALY